MVFAIIAIIGLIGVLILFKDQIKAFADDLQKEPTEEEQDRQDVIDERGAITNTGTFLFGEDFANFGKNFNDKIKTEQFNKMAREVKETQAKEAGFTSVEEFELKTDPSRTANLGLDELGKFNPPNTVGFGIAGIAGGKGLPDTPENRQKVFDFSRKGFQMGIPQVIVGEQLKKLIADTRTQNKPSRFGGQEKAKPVTVMTQEVRQGQFRPTFDEALINARPTNISQVRGRNIETTQARPKRIGFQIPDVLPRGDVLVSGIGTEKQFVEKPRVEPTITKAQESNLVVEVDRTKRSTRFR